MQLVALRQLYGDYGSVVAGQKFECPDEIARQLLLRDPQIVRRADPPKILYPPRVTYQTKVIPPAAVASEVAARPMFPTADGYVPLPDPQPEAVAAAGDSVLPAADLPKPGDAHHRGRRGSFRSAAE